MDDMVEVEAGMSFVSAAGSFVANQRYRVKLSDRLTLGLIAGGYLRILSEEVNDDPGDTVGLSDSAPDDLGVPAPPAEGERRKKPRLKVNDGPDSVGSASGATGGTSLDTAADETDR